MKDKSISDIITRAKSQVDTPKYIEGNKSYVVYYLKIEKENAHWAVKEFLDKNKADEFYLKKLHERMYELSMPFYKECKSRKR